MMTNEMLYNQGFRTHIESSFFLASPKLSFDELCLKIQGLIECGTLRKDFVHFDEEDKKNIYFKYSFEEMKSFLGHHDYTFVDVKKPGRRFDSFCGVVWKLKNLLQHEKEEELLDLARCALENNFSNGAETHRVKKIDFYDRISQEEFLESFYKEYNGMPIGEYHNEPYSKEFLIYHAEKLQKIGVNYIFLEHFSEGLQKSLDAFFEIGSMPQDLLIYVEDLDRRFEIEQNAYNFKALLFQLQKYGIKFIAIETTYSYAITADLDGDSTKRMLGMNYLFKERHDALLREKPKAKWVSLTGVDHTTIHANVLGIAQMLNRPSLFVTGGLIQFEEGASISSAKPILNTPDSKEISLKRKAASLQEEIVPFQPSAKIKPQ